MLELLGESGFLDGQVRRVASIYRSLGLHAAEDVVSIAVMRLYSRLVSENKPLVEKPDAYLTKAVLGIAHNEAQHRKGGRDAVAAHSLIDHAHEGDEASRDVLRTEAVGVARLLVSRLGQQNVQRVMEFVLEAVEQVEPVSRQEIAEALDLKPNTVSKLIERGITRLARVAEEEGYDLTLDYALALEEEPDLEDDDSDVDESEE